MTTKKPTMPIASLEPPFATKKVSASRPNKGGRVATVENVEFTIIVVVLAPSGHDLRHDHALATACGI